MACNLLSLADIVRASWDAGGLVLLGVKDNLSSRHLEDHLGSGIFPDLGRLCLSPLALIVGSVEGESLSLVSVILLAGWLLPKAAVVETLPALAYFGRGLTSGAPMLENGQVALSAHHQDLDFLLGLSWSGDRRRFLDWELGFPCLLSQLSSSLGPQVFFHLLFDENHIPDLLDGSDCTGPLLFDFHDS